MGKIILISESNLSADMISAMGISTQRSTFITWSKKTGRHFHNLITWKDLRADPLVKQWNESLLWKVGNVMVNISLKKHTNSRT